MSDSDFYDGRTFSHVKMARCLIDQFHCCWIEGQLHIYLDDGLYHAGPDAVHGAIASVLPELTDAKRREVVRFLSVSYETPKRELATDRYIPFQDRVFDTLTEGFLDYSPGLPFVYRIPHIYRLDAQRQESVDSFLMANACYDADLFLLKCELLGRMVSGSTKHRGFEVGIGQGQNGKTTEANFRVQLVGRENCCFLSLQDLNEKFRLAELYGKLLCCGDDIPASAIMDSSTLKKAVTGDWLTAERKGQNPFSFRNRAFLSFACNTLPPISDRSDGLYSRLIVMPFNADYSKAESRDVSLKDKVWSEPEMEYAIWLAMEGLKRLDAQGGFSKPKAVQEAVSQYRSENDPIEDFLEDYGSITGQPVKMVYDLFVDWSHSAGHRNVLTRTRFSREITQKTGLTIKTARHEYFRSRGKDSGRCFSVPVMDNDIL